MRDSQGGGAAPWTEIEAPSYAPDVQLSAAVALPVTASLAKGLRTSKSGMLSAGLIVAGLGNAYPDLAFNDYVRASSNGRADRRWTLPERTRDSAVPARRAHRRADLQPTL